jgi:6-pyruvoyltetrahydropterin/6-carboxytetrahydropterin synthase
MAYQSIKVYDGFSACFRQWRADGTHCKFLHGYGVSFEVTWEGDLDERNWVFDFGGLKRSKNLICGKNPKEFLDWLLDHTVLVAQDDPELSLFEMLDKKQVIQLRVIPATGAERFAEYLFEKLNDWVAIETQGRVRVAQVKFMEHGKNSAIFRPENKVDLINTPSSFSNSFSSFFEAFPFPMMQTAKSPLRKVE